MVDFQDKTEVGRVGVGVLRAGAVAAVAWSPHCWQKPLEGDPRRGQGAADRRAKLRQDEALSSSFFHFHIP